MQGVSAETASASRGFGLKGAWEQLRKPLAGCGGKGLPEQEDTSNLQVQVGLVVPSASKDTVLHYRQHLLLDLAMLV